MAHALRKTLIATIVGACAMLGPAAANDGGAPRQSRPQQLAQACRTLCIEEFNACQRACDTAPTRIDCISRCQTRLNLCTSACR
jgi:hypothetical protein